MTLVIELKVLSRGEGRTQVELILILLDQGVTIYFGGGTSHIGSVVYGEPYRRDDGSFGCTLSMINPLKHKEYLIATEMCKKVVTTTGKPAAVIGGIHVDDATPEEIKTITENANALTTSIIEYLVGKHGRKKE